MKHATWRSPMPVDPTAKERAFVWLSVGAAIITILPALYFRTWIPTLFPVLIAFLAWPVPAAYAKKRSIDLLKLRFQEFFEENDRPDAFPVLITVTRGNWTIGFDLGLLRFDNHRMVFEGLRTEFDLHIRDVTYGIEDNSIAVLNENNNATDLNIRIDRAWPPNVPESSRRGDLYLKDRDNFWRSAKSKSGESVLPPNTPFSANEMQVHRLEWLLISAFVTTFLVRFPVQIADLSWRIELTVSVSVYLVALFGVWLYLRWACPRALARIGTQDHRPPTLTVAEN